MPKITKKIRDILPGGYCRECGSSVMLKYLSGTIFQFGPFIGCIHPECEKYYKNR